MRHQHPKFLAAPTVIVLLVVSLFWGCQLNQPSSDISEHTKANSELWDLEPVFDAEQKVGEYEVSIKYYEWNVPTYSEFYVNDTFIGRGKVGVQQLILFLNSVGNGSKIDVHPKFVVAPGSMEIIHNTPFDYQAERINRILIRKNLTFEAPSSVCHRTGQSNADEH